MIPCPNFPSFSVDFHDFVYLSVAQIKDRRMRRLFRQKGLGPISTMWSHVCLRKLRGAYEEMRAVQIHHRTGKILVLMVVTCQMIPNEARDLAVNGT